MVHYFVVFLILSFFGGSLGTTTSPQQQNATEESEYSRQRSAYLLLDLYPPSNGIRMPGVSQRASRTFIRREHDQLKMKEKIFYLPL